MILRQVCEHPLTYDADNIVQNIRDSFHQRDDGNLNLTRRGDGG